MQTNKSLFLALFLFLLLVSFSKHGLVEYYRVFLQTDAYTLQHWEETPNSMKMGYTFPILSSQDWDMDTEVEWIKNKELFLFSQDRRYECPLDDVVIAERDYDFSYPETQLEKGELCIDTVNGQPVTSGLTITAGDGLSFVGWALDDAHLASPSAVYVQIADRYYLLETMERSDVADVYGCGAYVQSGFQGYVSTYGLEPGDYSANIIVISADGGSYYSALAVAFRIV